MNVVCLLQIISLLVVLNSYECFFDFDFKHFFIESGTVWCGSGNKAKNCDDLGEFAETDKCCREHDMCPYTFTKDSNSYNGFDFDELFTLSHCGCDAIFYECLLEKPYKENSYTIFSRYELLKLKCFAYLPCSQDVEDKNYENIYSNKLNRQTGSCVNGTRVMTFHSVDDYKNYLKSNLNQNQLSMVRNLLKTDQERFTSEKKKKNVCYNFFQEYPEKILNNFDQTDFIIKSINSPATQSTPLLSLAFIPPPLEVKTNNSKVDKKLLSSGKNEIKTGTSYLNNQSFIDITQGFSSFLFYFILPACMIFIIVLVFLFSKNYFQNRIQFREYRHANPLIS